MLLRSGKKIIIGYDLANSCSQISYCYQKEESDIATVGTVEGEENYDIPTVLCKRIGSNQWLFGNDALRFCKERPQEGILVTDLLNHALAGEPVQIDGRGYHPAALLALFIKRSLGMVAGVGAAEKIAAILFTCETLDERMKSLIQRVEGTLDLKNTVISCQSYEESLFAYMLYQPKTLWEDMVLLLDYRSRELYSVSLEKNTGTIPTVMYSSRRSFRFAGTDRELLDISKELCEGKQVSSVYLIGEKFNGNWMEESLRYLCTGKRVFQGNNLYSKGACYTLLKERTGKNREEIVFLGPDALKANVGMKLWKRGEEAYHALLDAGMEWRTLEEVFEFYLKEDNHLELLIVPLMKSPSKHILMELDHLELLPEEVTRIRVKLTMPGENKLFVTVTDLGFGEFRQAMGGKWEKEIELY